MWDGVIYCCLSVKMKHSEDCKAEACGCLILEKHFLFIFHCPPRVSHTYLTYQFVVFLLHCEVWN